MQNSSYLFAVDAQAEMSEEGNESHPISLTRNNKGDFHCLVKNLRNCPHQFYTCFRMDVYPFEHVGLKRDIIQALLMYPNFFQKIFYIFLCMKMCGDSDSDVSERYVACSLIMDPDRY